MKKLWFILIIGIFLISSAYAIPSDAHVWETDNGKFMFCDSNSYFELTNGNEACSIKYGNGIAESACNSEYKQISGCGLSGTKIAMTCSCIAPGGWSEPAVSVYKPHVWQKSSGNFVYCNGKNPTNYFSDGNVACSTKYGRASMLNICNSYNQTTSCGVIASKLCRCIFSGGEPAEVDFTAESINGGCVENWICTAWGSCKNDVQTRTCTDNNNCGTTSNKPVESQNCNVSYSNYIWETKVHGFIVCKGGEFDISYTPDRLNNKDCSSLNSRYPNAKLSCFPPGSTFKCMYNTRGCNYNDRPCILNSDCNSGEICDKNDFICKSSGESFTLSVPTDNCGNGVVDVGEQCDIVKYINSQGYNSFSSALDACKAKYPNQNIQVGSSNGFKTQNTGCGEYESRMWECILLEEEEIPVTPPVTSSGGGGGGGGHGTTTTISGESRTSLEVDIVNGVSRYLDLNNKGTFEFKGEKHEIYLKEIKSDSVIIVFESEPIEVELKLGETKQIDINADGNNDLNVKLVNIYNGMAEVLVKEIKAVEKKVVQEETKTEEKKGMENISGAAVSKFNMRDYAIGATLILIAAVFVVLVIRIIKK